MMHLRSIDIHQSKQSRLTKRGGRTIRTRVISMVQGRAHLRSCRLWPSKISTKATKIQIGKTADRERDEDISSNGFLSSSSFWDIRNKQNGPEGVCACICFKMTGTKFYVRSFDPIFYDLCQEQRKKDGGVAEGKERRHSHVFPYFLFILP